MKQFIITLSDDTAHILELRAAIDNLRTEQAISNLLTHIVKFWQADREAKDAANSRG